MNGPLPASAAYPQRIILDNLKSGVLKADIYDPAVNRAYADMERHYRLCRRPGEGNDPEHKGKVERAVPDRPKAPPCGKDLRRHQ